MKQKRTIQDYLKIAEKLGVDPNFYTSLAYLECSKAECWEDKGWLYLVDEDTRESICILPPLIVGEIRDTLSFDIIWSNFGERKREGYLSTFHDWEYLYDPKNFDDISGGEWETFRKNVRKWPVNHPRWEYSDKLRDVNEIDVLLALWMEDHRTTIQDANLIISYLYDFQRTDIHRKYLYQEGILYGITAWDENWKYINFRLCITRARENYLQEFIRSLFYIDPEIRNIGKLVNDGGDCGIPSLGIFKDKLHPKRKRIIYQHIRQ